MKNRSTIVVAFLLAAVMLLGVGYAALSDTLDITGIMMPICTNSSIGFLQLLEYPL